MTTMTMQRTKPVPKARERRQVGGIAWRDLVDDDQANTIGVLECISGALQANVSPEAAALLTKATGMLARQTRTHHEMRQIGAANG